MVHRRLGAVARVSWGFPHIWPEAQVPFPLEFIPPALSPPPTGLCVGGGLKPPPECPQRPPEWAYRPFQAPFRRLSGGRVTGTAGKPGEIADLTLSSGRGPGRVSSKMRRIDVDPAVAPPCAHRARSHEARRPWPMRAGWPYIDQQPKLPNGPCSSSRLMVVVSRGIPIPPLGAGRQPRLRSFPSPLIWTGCPSP